MFYRKKNLSKKFPHKLPEGMRTNVLRTSSNPHKFVAHKLLPAQSAQSDMRRTNQHKPHKPRTEIFFFL